MVEFVRKLKPVSGPQRLPPTESLDQYRRLIESLTDYAIVALSLDGSIASWNSGAEFVFGYTADEALGNHYSLLFTPEDVARGFPNSELQKALVLGKETVEGWHRRKDGRS